MTPMSVLDWVLVAVGAFVIVGCMVIALWASKNPEPPPPP